MTIHDLVSSFKDENPRKLTNKQLRWLVNNPPPAPILVEITPGLAEEMLTYNISNRRLHAANLAKMTRRMISGWPTTKCPIVFSDARFMRDGQHRLRACVNSECSFVAWVAFGDDDKNFNNYDIGDVRTPGDIFTIHGVANADKAAAITRAVATIDRQQLAGKGGGFAAFDSPADVYDLYLEYGAERIQESVKICTKLGHNKIIWPASLAAVHFFCARKSRKAADEFFLKVATGVGFQSTREKPRKLRERLVKVELSRVQASGDTIQAWNALRLRKSISEWYSEEGGTLPTIV